MPGSAHERFDFLDWWWLVKKHRAMEPRRGLEVVKRGVRGIYEVLWYRNGAGEVRSLVNRALVAEYTPGLGWEDHGRLPDDIREYAQQVAGEGAGGAVPLHETSGRSESQPKKSPAQIKREVDEILAGRHDETSSAAALPRRQISGSGSKRSHATKKVGLVTVETMPEYLKGSHRAARNWGVYPHNGAIRERVTREEADEIMEADPDGYAHIVGRRVQAHATRSRGLASYRNLVQKAIARCSKHPRPNHSLYECVFEEVNGGAPYPTPQMRRILEDAVHAARPTSNLHARKKKLDPHEAKQHLKTAGVDFSSDFHQLPSSQVQLILETARAAGYRKHKGAPGSTARMYFQYLSRLR